MNERTICTKILETHFLFRGGNPQPHSERLLVKLKVNTQLSNLMWLHGDYTSVCVSFKWLSLPLFLMKDKWLYRVTQIHLNLSPSHGAFAPRASPIIRLNNQNLRLFDFKVLWIRTSDPASLWPSSHCVQKIKHLEKYQTISVYKKVCLGSLGNVPAEYFTPAHVWRWNPVSRDRNM